MSHNKEAEQKLIDQTVEAFKRNAGNIRATAMELGVARSTVRERVKKMGLGKKPIAGGTRHGVIAKKEKLPVAGEIRRYILTSAQNNTHVNSDFLDNLEELGRHYNARIIVGTYTYNQNHYGQLSVKRGKDKPMEKELWYDPRIEPYILDYRLQLAPGLVFAGEYNALPTAVNPLAGLDSYTGRQSAIFPHAKLAMRSIATMQGEGVKLNYTTGTVTERNYIQKREGVIAEFHHIYGALLVEVDSEGHWWVRQLNQDEGTGTLQDLHVLVQHGKIVSTDAKVEAITYGDLHGVEADLKAVTTSQDMRDVLNPKYQFLHDVMAGLSNNPHDRKYKNNHIKFHTWLRGYHRLEVELRDTANLIETFAAPGIETVIVDSNHDDAWIKRWLKEYDYRVDPGNAELFLDMQQYFYAKIRNNDGLPVLPRDINMIEYALYKHGQLKGSFKFLKADESFLTCNRKIENGMHGHYGIAGRRGTPEQFSKMGRKAITAHTHSTGIYNGLYVAGTLSNLRWDYNVGPSNWTQSNVVTYPNGKRTIVTLYAGKWRA